MKKITLIFALLFASVSSSFAYGSQTIETYKNGVGYNYMQININSYLQVVTMDCSWSGLEPEYSSGSAVAYGTTATGDQLIGEYSYHSSMNSPYYYNSVYHPQTLYWNTITAYLSSSNCNGQLRVDWYQ